MSRRKGSEVSVRKTETGNMNRVESNFEIQTGDECRLKYRDINSEERGQNATRHCVALVYICL
jgi:hypothetical protein